MADQFITATKFARAVGMTPETIRRAARGESPSGKFMHPDRDLMRDAQGRWRVRVGALFKVTPKTAGLWEATETGAEKLVQHPRLKSALVRPSTL